MALQELRGQERDRGLDLPPLRSVIRMNQPALFGDGELAGAPDSIAAEAFSAWNDAAKVAGWPIAQHNTAGRPAKLRRTIKDVGGLHAWRALLERCTKSDFLCGRARSGDRKPFVLSLDWIVKPANLLKVMEGNYFRDDAPVPTSIRQQIAPEDQWAKFLRDYQGRRSFWPTSLGPRPEEPQCRAPAAMLAACRERLGIVVSAPVTESREDRLRATIISYRKIGRWEDANRVERQLAAAEGRPPVEVPAPEARDPDRTVSKQMQDMQKATGETSVNNRHGGFWNPPTRADAVSRRMAAREQAQDIPVEYDGIPEGDYSEEHD